MEPLCSLSDILGHDNKSKYRYTIRASQQIGKLRQCTKNWLPLGGSVQFFVKEQHSYPRKSNNKIPKEK